MKNLLSNLWKTTNVKLPVVMPAVNLLLIIGLFFFGSYGNRLHKGDLDKKYLMRYAVALNDRRAGHPADSLEYLFLKKSYEDSRLLPLTPEQQKGEYVHVTFALYWPGGRRVDGGKGLCVLSDGRLKTPEELTRAGIDLNSGFSAASQRQENHYPKD